MAQKQKWFTHICSVLSVMLMVLSLTACGHIHKWQDATCARPKTCTDCGEIRGEALGHNVPEDGICTNCKQKQDNVLTLEKKSRLYPPIMYGGVFLRMYISSEKNGTMFPGQYTLYAEDETVVADGDWGRITFVETGPSSGKSPEFTDTEYILLQPGSYQVRFSYYTKYDYDDIVTKSFVPVGEPISATFYFIVK